MRRIVLVLMAAGVALVAAWALAALPGRMTATIGDITFEASTPVVALGALLGFVLLYVLFRLLGAAFRLPRTLSARAVARRRKAGDTATTRTLLALAAGETGEARREASRARRLLGDTPATLLLAAEAGRIAGRIDEAEAAFRTLAERTDAAFLGLRGLLRHAVEREDWQEAANLAGKAEAVQPGAAWLRRERARLAVRAGNWSDALALADPDAAKAALATGAADAESDASRAIRLAKEAWRDDPSLAPAALAYARRLRAAGRENRALAAIRHSWSIAPHPALAAFALEPISDPLARMQAARKLTEANPDHVESHLLLARAALDAGLTGEARRYAEAARSARLNQRRLWLLMADIEEAEGGDQRESLRHAATAEPDPAWRCDACHAAHAEWHPACPTCVSVGSLRWTTGGSVAAPMLHAPPVATLLP